ncbi:heterokaryon incompatibility protein-domain-containing protein [Xylaria venustula]|nr:heterokaryon incompatibility protein-domain-containing protein [Xylaria venustula]
MRLIHSKTLQFHEFEQSSSGVPPYAILSHTWGDEEVTFRHMSSGPTATCSWKKGFAKITETCRLAQEHNLDYVWIDTCCIDKSSSAELSESSSAELSESSSAELSESSSAELSESINSMFKWYENAAVCYVFLSDYVSGGTNFESCRWWSRGWTLQELLAPPKHIFYDALWESVGTKLSLLWQISSITGIEEEVLRDKSQIPLRSVSQRMAWAAFRQTTRMEDEAYCLLGIFGIYLPLLYGEGRMAFRRLQEEIIKRNADLTIFFWDARRSGIEEPQYISLFAESPKAFGMVKPITSITSGFPEFFITNKGVFFSVAFYLPPVIRSKGKGYLYYYFLGCDSNNLPVGILLRKIGPGIFCRANHYLEKKYSVGPKTNNNGFYIITDPGPNIEAQMIQFRQLAFHLPDNGPPGCQFQLMRTVPSHLWDATDRVFLRAPESVAQWRLGSEYYSVIVAMIIKVHFTLDFDVDLIVLCEDDVTFVNKLKIFEAEKNPEVIESLFGETNRETSVPSSEFRKVMANTASLGNRVEICLQPSNQRALVSLSIRPGTLQVMSKEISVSDFALELVML